MKRFLCLCVALMLLLAAVPASAEYRYNCTPGEADDMFTVSFNMYVPWSRTVNGSGMSESITEKAMIDGHPYEFRVDGNGREITEISLHGWFEDLATNDDEYLSFPVGLQAYNYCLRVIYDTLMPDGNAVDYWFSAYEIYPKLKSGLFYNSKTIPGWTVQTAKQGVLELLHTSGAYMLLTVTGDTFNLYANPAGYLGC